MPPIEKNIKVFDKVFDVRDRAKLRFFGLSPMEELATPLVRVRPNDLKVASEGLGELLHGRNAKGVEGRTDLTAISGPGRFGIESPPEAIAAISSRPVSAERALMEGSSEGGFVDVGPLVRGLQWLLSPFSTRARIAVSIRTLTSSKDPEKCKEAADRLLEIVEKEPLKFSSDDITALAEKMKDEELPYIAHVLAKYANRRRDLAEWVVSLLLDSAGSSKDVMNELMWLLLGQERVLLKPRLFGDLAQAAIRHGNYASAVSILARAAEGDPSKALSAMLSLMKAFSKGDDFDLMNRAHDLPRTFSIERIHMEALVKLAAEGDRTAAIVVSVFTRARPDLFIKEDVAIILEGVRQGNAILTGAAERLATARQEFTDELASGLVAAAADHRIAATSAMSLLMSGLLMRELVPGLFVAADRGNISKTRLLVVIARWLPYFAANVIPVVIRTMDISEAAVLEMGTIADMLPDKLLAQHIPALARAAAEPSGAEIGGAFVRIAKTRPDIFSSDHVGPIVDSAAASREMAGALKILAGAREDLAQLIITGLIGKVKEGSIAAGEALADIADNYIDRFIAENVGPLIDAVLSVEGTPAEQALYNLIEYMPEWFTGGHLLSLRGALAPTRSQAVWALESLAKVRPELFSTGDVGLFAKERARIAVEFLALPERARELIIRAICESNEAYIKHVLPAEYPEIGDVQHIIDMVKKASAIHYALLHLLNGDPKLFLADHIPDIIAGTPLDSVTVDYFVTKLILTVPHRFTPEHKPLLIGQIRNSPRLALGVEILVEKRPELFGPEDVAALAAIKDRGDLIVPILDALLAKGRQDVFQADHIPALVETIGKSAAGKAFFLKLAAARPDLAMQLLTGLLE